MSEFGIRAAVDKEGKMDLISIDVVSDHREMPILNDSFQGGSQEATQSSLFIPDLKTVYPKSVLHSVITNSKIMNAIAVVNAEDTHEDVKIVKPSRASQVTAKSAREAVNKMFEVGKPEDFDGKLSSVFSPYKIRLLNNSQAVTQEDIIEAIQGNLNEAQFDYVINATGELLGLQAKELILKLCK